MCWSHVDTLDWQLREFVQRSVIFELHLYPSIDFFLPGDQAHKAYYGHIRPLLILRIAIFCSFDTQLPLAQQFNPSDLRLWKRSVLQIPPSVSCQLSSRGAPEDSCSYFSRRSVWLDVNLRRSDSDECCASASVCPQGDFTWKSVSGRSIGLKPVPLQSLSELERCRLQDVAFRRLLRDRGMGCHIAIPKSNAKKREMQLYVTNIHPNYQTPSWNDCWNTRREEKTVCEAINCCFLMSSIDGHKHKKSLRQKLDSLSKEKSKDKGEDLLLLLSSPDTQPPLRPSSLKARRSESGGICKDVSEGALTAAPAAAIWQESNVFCQKSSGGEKKTSLSGGSSLQCIVGMAVILFTSALWFTKALQKVSDRTFSLQI